MKPKTKKKLAKRVAWTLMILGCIGWPITAFTIAKDEPQFILGLSWLAIILTALDGIMVADEDI